MPNRLLRSLLFLSSYSPVLAIMALKSYGISCPIFIFSLLFLTAAVVGIALFWMIAKRHTPFKAKVLDVESRDADLAGYLVAYLLPFLGVIATGWRDVLALALFFAFVGIVYVNSRMIYINPILALFGYHLYEIKATTAQGGNTPDRIASQFLVTKHTWVRPEDHLTVRRVMADALIELSDEGRHDSK